jgi:hypothetical protein
MSNNASHDNQNNFELQKMMHKPATAETWQTAFRNDLGSMAWGDNKMGQKGTNAMFVMTNNKIKHMY